MSCRCNPSPVMRDRNKFKVKFRKLEKRGELRNGTTKAKTAKSKRMARARAQSNILPMIEVPKAVEAKHQPRNYFKDAPELHFRYRYLCVVDFEATCVEEGFNVIAHEIIEFPVVVIDLFDNGKTVHEFHSYVRPTERPRLTEFCTRLTGIKQETVDAAPTLPEVLADFEEWRISKGLEYNQTHRNFMFVTDGSTDLNGFLDGECRRKSIDKHSYFDDWIDIKNAFVLFYNKKKPRSMKYMLRALDKTFIGRPHSGIDDARNIARIAVEMAKEGEVFIPNERIYHESAKPVVATH